MFDEGLYVTQSECGDSSFSAPNGFVMSPNFPLPHPSNMNCKYAIVVGLKNSVQLKIKHFSLDSRHQTCDCPTHWLMVSAINVSFLALMFFYYCSTNFTVDC